MSGLYSPQVKSEPVYSPQVRSGPVVGPGDHDSFRPTSLVLPSFTRVGDVRLGRVGNTIHNEINLPKTKVSGENENRRTNDGRTEVDTGEVKV